MSDNSNNKLPLRTPDLSNKNYTALAALFPNAVTETINENGEVVRAIDADVLAQEINTHVVSGKEERYQFTWPDKKNSVLLAKSSITVALRPCRDESVNFDNTENLYIEGDNLNVLKLLRETYLNRVKMIYIDPPYNTGNDFIYNDDFAGDADKFLDLDYQYDDYDNRMVQNLDSNGRFHTDWLNMIYPRLRTARDLLADDGVIFISIDDNELENLKKICNEVFGERNFVSLLTIIVKTEGRRYGAFAKTHENIIVYAKNYISATFNQIEVAGKDFSYQDNFGGFNLQELRNQNTRAFNSSNRPNLRYPFYVDITNPDNDGFCKVSVDAIPAYKEVNAIEINGNKSVWRWGKEKSRANQETELVARKGNDGIVRIYQKYRKLTEEPKTVWFGKEFISNKGTKEIQALLGNGIFDFPKPVALIQQLITIVANDDDIILDFFSGSSTTAHAVMQLNAEDGGKRKFIMVQLPDVCAEDSEAAKAGYKNICEIGKERIRRAGERIVSSNQFSVFREEMKRYGCVKLSRSDCLAESNGFNNGDLQDCEKASEGGTLFAFGSNETCGSVDSVKYSRRTRQEFKQGIPPLSGDSERFEGGTGDTASDMQQGWLPCRYGHFGSDATFKGNRQNAECPNFKTENCPLKTDNYLDIGFRVLKLDSSNMKDVYYTPQDIVSEIGSLQIDLDGFTDNIKPDRTAEDLLFQVMLDFGILLSSKIEKREIGDKTVFSVADNYLIACFDRVTDEIVTEIAKTKPYYAVFRDSSFYNDASLVNFEQIFRTYSPTTVRKVL